MPGCGHGLVAEEQEILRPGNCDTTDRVRVLDHGTGVRIRGVIGRRDIEDDTGISDVERKDRDAIERAAGGHDAVRRERAETGLEAHEIVEGRGNAAGAGRVRAEREGAEALRHGDGGARAGAAGNPRRIERIAGHRERRPYADQPGRELVEVRLADRDCARGLQALDDRGAAPGEIGEGRAARARRRAGEIDIVLDREREAPERVSLRIERRERVRRGAECFDRDGVEEDARIRNRSIARRKGVNDDARLQPGRIGGVQIVARQRRWHWHQGFLPCRPRQHVSCQAYGAEGVGEDRVLRVIRPPRSPPLRCLLVVAFAFLLGSRGPPR